MEHRPDPPEAPHLPAGGVPQMMGVDHSELLLICHQVFDQDLALDRDIGVLLTPGPVDQPQLFRTDAEALAPADVPFRIHEQQDVVGVPAHQLAVVEHPFALAGYP